MVYASRASPVMPVGEYKTLTPTPPDLGAVRRYYR